MAPGPGRAAALAGAALLLMSACGPAGSGGDGVDLYAAVSLRQPLVESRARLEAVAGAPVNFNFGASNDLARQIVAARRADLFLSADEVQMDVVERAGLVAPGTRRRILSNRLVVVVPRDAPARRIEGSGDLVAPWLERLSIADPAGVPAGRYAKAWLQSAGLWERLRGRIVPAVDARAALAAVESGGAQAGVVYATDAALSERIRVVWKVEGPGAPEITYAAAVLKDAAHPEAARRLLDFLDGGGAEEVFGRFGFIAR